jgi:hypothetical protein
MLLSKRSINHVDLLNKGTNTHVQIDTFIASGAAGLFKPIAYASGYVLSGHCDSFNPTNSSTYAIGGNSPAPASVFGTIERVPIPFAGSIKQASVMWYASGSAGSSENIQALIRLGNSSDIAIQTIGSTAAAKTFSVTGLNQAVVQNNYIEIKLICPAWATPPTGVRLTWCVYIEC